MKFYKIILSLILLLAIVSGYWWFNLIILAKIGPLDKQIKQNYQDKSDKIKVEYIDNLVDIKEKIHKKISNISQEKNKEITANKIVNNKILKVPFMVQAPYGDWDNNIYQNGCEEASVIMAMAWIRGEKLDSAIADKKIIAMTNWQKQHYGCAVDTSAEDTVKRLFNEYSTYKKVVVKNVNDINGLINELKKGNLIIVPTNGQLLDNPYYTAPGPTRHNLVIYNYDELTNEFVSNDPGTKRGEAYRYSVTILFNAIRDYPSGCHVLNVGNEKVMIVVEVI